MFASAMRSGVIVKDEMPTSYLDPTAGMMPSNGADCTSVSRPSTEPMAFATSMSKPIGVWPSVSMNSAGA